MKRSFRINNNEATKAFKVKQLAVICIAWRFYIIQLLQARHPANR